MTANNRRSPESLWYKDAILYELHVRAFYDSDGDGIGDFRGLAEKLDYLRDVGVTAVWLLPFYPSPLRDDGYDIANYSSVHPSYGTLNDFKQFLREAHRRGLRVITELVLNHTSDQHPWFQRARRSPPGSPWRNFYVWNDNPDKYRDARIIFGDFEHSNWAYDPAASAYYWHRFYSHQPDLNFDSPDVHRALFQVVDFWLAMGVDGLRLDAVPYLYEREGTNCENLPETHEFLKKLRRHVDERFGDRMLLAEANQWPEDAVAYFGNGDECHTAFHFPLMPRMFMAVQLEDRYPIIDILMQTPPVPENAQWCLFLRNHDELTLEMVTDEERDYMYRIYARDPQARLNLGIRRRLAPLLGYDRKKIELMYGLLMSLPGTPIIYYGDELGMGDNVFLGDRNGVRTPMQWSPDRNAGFSRANPQRLYLPVIIDPESHYEVINVETRRNNPNSLFWFMKRLIALRKQYQAFGRGTLELLAPDNPKVLAFVRRYQDQVVLVVANLSRLAQFVELDLSAFGGSVPVELFGRTPFPAVGDRPYFLTLGPHAFLWFALEPQRAQVPEVNAAEVPAEIPVLRAEGGWESLFRRESRSAIEALLPDYLVRYRWFGGKARKQKSVAIEDTIPIDDNDVSPAYLVLIYVDYTEGDPERYALYLAFASGERAREVERDFRYDILARVIDHDREAVIFSGVRQADAAQVLLDAIVRRRRFRGGNGEVAALPTRDFRQLRGSDPVLSPALLRTDQSNSSINYGDRLILKLFRRIEAGVNPELEVSRFLTEQTTFRNLPRVAGHMEYRQLRGDSFTTGILTEYVPNQGDALSFTLDSLARFFENAMTQPPEVRDGVRPHAPLLELSETPLPERVPELMGPYLASVHVLAERTAQMHIALASRRDDPRFAPEPFTALYQRSVYQSMRNECWRGMQTLRRRLAHVPEDARILAQRVLHADRDLISRVQQVLARKIVATRTRIHGDYHLGQVLWTGKDFVIIDFEGEPSRPVSERRIKRSPLRDVAGMIRSFHYAAAIAMRNPVEAGVLRPEIMPAVEDWARSWYLWTASTFLGSYLKVAAGQSFLPQGREELAILLNAYLLQKSVYELVYELNHRPEWVAIPLQGILQLLDLDA